MSHRYAYRWMIGLALVAALAGVGFYAYNLGVAQGLAESSRLVAPGAAAPVIVWARPWGFGFFPFFPLLFIFFWIFVLRGLFWRGRWGGRGGGYRGYPGVPPEFDEWHRRAHAQANPPTQL